jgi:hypothetical protein
MAHSRSLFVTQGAGVTTMHQGGASGDAACSEIAAAAGHKLPQAVAPVLAVAAQAKAVEVCSEPLSVRSMSSQHHYEEHELRSNARRAPW